VSGWRRRLPVPPQALWTAAHENLPVTFIVMNNLEYNILKNFMKDSRATVRQSWVVLSGWI
jgi:thiamine pyrophosphate-dependent acetolactate synthase large subunit-like protein